jgi:hypothetical protein
MCCAVRGERLPSVTSGPLTKSWGLPRGGTNRQTVEMPGAVVLSDGLAGLQACDTADLEVCATWSTARNLGLSRDEPGLNFAKACISSATDECVATNGGPGHRPGELL